MRLKDLNIKIYKNFTKELEEEWINFEKYSINYYFQTYSWQKYWFKQIKKYKEKSISIYIVVVKKNDEILFILPFCIKNIFIFKILSWSGYPFSDYNGPLINKSLNITKDEFNLIWKSIIKSSENLFDCISLLNQPEFIQKKKNPFYYFLNIKKKNFYFGIFLSEQLTSKKKLSDIKYQIKRLSKIDNLSYNYAKNNDERKKILRFIIKKKISQYKRTKAWNIFEINAYKKFFIQSNLKLDANLSSLTLGRDIIAAHSGYIYKDSFYYLFPVYDENFKKYSPGKILLDFLINDSMRKKLNYFDFTIGSETYKKKLANNMVRCGTALQSLNLRGVFYILFINIYEFLKIFNLRTDILRNILNNIKKYIY